jgi:hypothetical protein
MAIILSHRWTIRFNLQQFNGIDALFKSKRLHIFWKCDLNLSNMFFRLSIWPNGHRESQEYAFESGMVRTNEAAGLIIFLPSSAQNHAWFYHKSLIWSRKYMN